MDEQSDKMRNNTSKSEADSINLDSGRNKHLDGFSEDEKSMIKLMAEIFVKHIMDDIS